MSCSINRNMTRRPMVQSYKQTLFEESQLVIVNLLPPRTQILLVHVRTCSQQCYRALTAPPWRLCVGFLQPTNNISLRSSNGFMMHHKAVLFLPLIACKWRNMNRNIVGNRCVVTFCPRLDSNLGPCVLHMQVTGYVHLHYKWPDRARTD